jgi:hypothetical protein
LKYRRRYCSHSLRKTHKKERRSQGVLTPKVANLKEGKCNEANIEYEIIKITTFL